MALQRREPIRRMSLPNCAQPGRQTGAKAGFFVRSLSRLFMMVAVVRFARVFVELNRVKIEQSIEQSIRLSPRELNACSVDWVTIV